MTARVVRRLSAAVTHIVNVPDGTLVVARMMGKPFYGVPLPAITTCGAKLSGQIAVAMQGGTVVGCARCRRLTGMRTAPPDNHLVGSLTAAARSGAP